MYDYGRNETPWADYISTKVKKIVIGNDITYIGNYAFYYCEVCTSIQLPSSLEEIGRNAFAGCTKLTAINLPSKVKYLHNGAFGGRSSALKTITLNEGLEYIGPNAFPGLGNFSVTSVTIPSSVSVIGEKAFYQVQKVVINEGVKSIKALSFVSCNTSTQSFEIPNSVIEIGDGAFCANHSLRNITVGTGIKYMGWYCFASNNLKTLTIKNGNPPMIVNDIPITREGNFNPTIVVPKCSYRNNYLYAQYWKDLDNYETYTDYDAYCGNNDELYPTNLHHKYSSNKLNIYWDEMPDASYYEVEILSGNTVILSGSKITFSNSLSIDLSGVEGRKMFTYRVRSIPRSFAASKSDWNYGDFDSEMEPTTVDYTPTNLRTTISGEKVTFNWNSVSGASKYELDILYNNTSILNSTFVTTGTTASIDFSTLKPGYYSFTWQVRSLDSNGNALSSWANNSFAITIEETQYTYESYKPNHAEFWYYPNKEYGLLRLYVINDNESVDELLQIGIYPKNYNKLADSYINNSVMLSQTIYYKSDNNQWSEAVEYSPMPYVDIEYKGDSEYRIYSMVALDNKTIKMVLNVQLPIYAGTLDDNSENWESYSLKDVVTAIDDIKYEVLNLDPTQPMYNILGMPVDNTYKGIVIQNGRKFYLR